MVYYSIMVHFMCMKVIGSLFSQLHLASIKHLLRATSSTWTAENLTSLFVNLIQIQSSQHHLKVHYISDSFQAQM